MEILVSLNDFIENHGGLWSMIGLLLTIITLVLVNSNKKVIEKFNKKNFKKNRLPKNLEDLKDISSKLDNYSINFEENKTQIKTETAKVIVILNSVNKSLDKTEMEHYKKLKKEGKKLDKLKFNDENWFTRNIPFLSERVFKKNHVSDFQIKLDAFITDLDNIIKDNKNIIS